MNERSSLAERLEDEMRDAGLFVAVQDTGDAIVLTGQVMSEGDREAAHDIVEAAVGGTRQIEDNLEVSGALPESTDIGDLSPSEVAGFAGAEPGTEDSESLDAGDFTDQETVSSFAGVQAGSVSNAASDGPDVASGGDVAYVPPVDPVGTDRTVIGGFQASSMDSISVERSSDGTFGDEAIRDAVLRELREDSATTGLQLTVTVLHGVVRLDGHVDDVTDAENAQEVASRVPGVVDVREELEVEHLS